MSAVFEIPLQTVHQQFNITLNNVEYQFTVRWCAPAQAWTLDIADATGTTQIANGLQLTTGADLLGQLAYLGISGALQIQTDHDVDAVPTFTNLGQTSHLYFIV